MIRKALVMLASATLVASAAPQQYESYDYAEPVKQFCLVIPKGLQTVRGILVVCNYMGGDFGSRAETVDGCPCCPAMTLAYPNTEYK